MHPSTPALSGCVLAGGRSSRFGSNKAFAVVDGETLVERALTALRRLGCRPVIVAKPRGPYDGLGVPVIDTEGPQAGPVAGWKAGLEAASADWVLVLSVDMPFVTWQVLRALMPETLPRKPQAFCFPRSDGTWHPFPGLYHRDLAGLASDLGPAPSMQSLLSCFPVKASTLPGNPDRVLSNINRPADIR